MTVSKAHDYKQEVHQVMDASCHLGQELHVATTNAYGDRILNLRMFRVMPSKTGYTGYTKVGIFLTRQETKHLRDVLTGLIEKDEAWLVDGGEWNEMEND